MIQVGESTSGKGFGNTSRNTLSVSVEQFEAAMEEGISSCIKGCFELVFESTWSDEEGVAKLSPSDIDRLGLCIDCCCRHLIDKALLNSSTSPPSKQVLSLLSRAAVLGWSKDGCHKDK